MARVKRLITKLAFQALALPPSDKKGKRPKRQFANFMVVTLPLSTRLMRHFRISCLRRCRKQGTFPLAAMVEGLTAKNKVIRTLLVRIEKVHRSRLQEHAILGNVPTFNPLLLRKSQKPKGLKALSELNAIVKSGKSEGKYLFIVRTIIFKSAS